VLPALRRDLFAPILSFIETSLAAALQVRPLPLYRPLLAESLLMRGCASVML
jgi:hypothetical protein